jgi:hypothetical protein
VGLIIPEKKRASALDDSADGAFGGDCEPRDGHDPFVPDGARSEGVRSRGVLLEEEMVPERSGPPAEPPWETSLPQRPATDKETLPLPDLKRDLGPEPAHTEDSSPAGADAQSPILSSRVSRAGRGGVLSLSLELQEAADLRLTYARLAAELDKLGITPEGTVAREALQEEARSLHNSLAEAWYRDFQKARQAAGYVARKSNPAKTNEALNVAARKMRRVGRTMMYITVTMDVIDVATIPPDQRAMEATKTVARWAGAYAGGKIGGALFAWSGPYGDGAAIIVFAIVGAIVGEEAVERAPDMLSFLEQEGTKRMIEFKAGINRNINTEGYQKAAEDPHLELWVDEDIIGP